MRLALSLFVSVAVAIVAQLLQSHSVPPRALTTIPLQRDEDATHPPGSVQRHREEETRVNERSTEGLAWLWKAINRVLPYVVAGWAAGRLVVQFRNIILAFICAFALFDFLLVQSGMLDLTMNWSDFESFLEGIKTGILRLGVVETFSLLLGMWAGIAGILQANRPKAAKHSHDSSTA